MTTAHTPSPTHRLCRRCILPVRALPDRFFCRSCEETLIKINKDKDVEERFEAFRLCADLKMHPRCRMSFRRLKGKTLEYIVSRKSKAICPECLQLLWDLRDLIIHSAPTVR